MKTRDILATFNRGRISRFAVARADVERVRLSAEEQTNWMPRVLGSMSIRPGLKKLGGTATVGGNGSYIPFVFSRDDTAIIEMTAFGMRVWDDGDSRITRNAVSATFTNGTFDADLTGWTGADESGAASTWATGGYMQLLGTGFAAAKRRQSIAISEPTTIHTMRITVERGPVLLRVGTTAGDDDIFRQAVLRTGAHSIAFDPDSNATVWIEFSSTLKYPTLIDSIAFESGVMTLPTPWVTDADNLTLRWHQSGDVVFVASNVQQRRIERRDNNSWSLVTYLSDDGPFLDENTSNISITPSAISGNISLTATQPVFRAGHVGSLWRLTSQGQRVEGALVADLTYTGEVRITGVGTDRRLTVSRSGTWTGSLRLQRSIGAPGAWVTVATYTGNATVTYNDGFDNTVAYYRIGFDSGDYGSGQADVFLEYSSGSITGTVRVTGYSSATLVGAVVVKDLGQNEATTIWAEGAWSDDRGWPTAVNIAQGRLWWFGGGRAYGSVSDAYTSFDPDHEGDAGPINRTVSDASGFDVNWAISLDRIIVGTGSAVQVIRSSSLDEPITPSNYNVKALSGKGSAAVVAAMSGTIGYFVGGDGISLYEVRLDQTGIDYSVQKMTILVPEISAAGIVKIAVQEEPDLRVYCVLSDGTAAVLVRDEAENVMCWINIETDGLIEDVSVLPAAMENRVFYRVSRTIGGVNTRYHEEFARFDECSGGASNLVSDSNLAGTGVVAGISHLEGKTVVVWADGVDQGSHLVVSGALPTLTTSFTTWSAGLPYEAKYKSAKLVGQTGLGVSMTQRTRINKIGLILADTHAQGLEYGPSYDVLDALPLVESGADVDGDSVWDAYDKDMIEFPGDWDTDNRICLVANAPRPCTVLAAVLNVDREDND